MEHIVQNVSRKCTFLSLSNTKDILCLYLNCDLGNEASFYNKYFNRLMDILTNQKHKFCKDTTGLSVISEYLLRTRRVPKMSRILLVNFLVENNHN